MRRLLTETEATLQTQVAYLTEGMPESYRLSLQIHAPKTPEEWIQLAVRLEESKQKRFKSKHRRDNPSVPPYPCPRCRDAGKRELHWLRECPQITPKPTTNTNSQTQSSEMSKNLMTGQPLISSKPSINGNIPFMPSHQWSSHSLPPQMPSLTPLGPSMGPLASMTSMGPLALPPTSMWSPMAPNYNYYNPRFNQLGPNTLHSNNCCLASYGQRNHCQHFDNSWTQNMNNCLISNNRDNNNNGNSNRIVESITEVNVEEEEENNSQVYKEIKQLKGINEMLKSSLEQTSNQLKQTQERLINLNEKFANDYIERYRINLKKYGDYIREECNRFFQNESIAQKLKPIVEQIRVASNKAKEEKENVRKLIAASHEIIKEENNPNLDLLSFDFNSLPEFPDLLSFYKIILDEIPLVFLSDLSQLKKFANDYIINKKSIDFSNALPEKSPFDSINSLSLASNSLFSVPNISDLPKPNFSIFSGNENIFKFNTNEMKANLPEIELTFPKNPSPIASFNTLPNSIDDPNTSTPIAFVNNSKEKPISPIGKPIELKNDSKVNKISSQNNLFSEENTQKLSNGTESGAKHPMQTTNNDSNQKSIANSNSNASKQNLSQAQNKLLAKLREKYTNLSDDLLIDSITQTKSSLIASGNPKGFSGMRVSDIIAKIGEYIDRNVILFNTISKSRNSRPIPTLKLISNQNNSKPIADNGVIGVKNEPKGWSKVDRKLNGTDDSICSICFESILRNKFETQCHHFFHDGCISNWIRKDGSCPICRSLVLSPGEYPEL